MTDNPTEKGPAPNAKIRPDDRRGAPPGGSMPQPHGGSIGNPPHQYSEEIAQKVEDLAARCSMTGIAALCGIERHTLAKFYSNRYHLGRAKMQATLGAMIVRKAIAGDINAAEKVMRGTGGWGNNREIAEVEKQKEESPEVELDLSGYSDDELALLKPLLAQLLEAATAGGTLQ